MTEVKPTTGVWFVLLVSFWTFQMIPDVGAHLEQILVSFSAFDIPALCSSDFILWSSSTDVLISSVARLLVGTTPSPS